MLKIFIAYVFLFSGGDPVGTIHLNTVYSSYEACMTGLKEAAPDIKKMAVESKVVPSPVCVEVPVPTEVKTND